MVLSCLKGFHIKERVKNIKANGFAFMKKETGEKTPINFPKEAYKIPVITPKLYGGYRLPAINRTLTPVYFPAINQIWVNSLPPEENIVALAHEGMHVCTISLQPAQLLPLRAELLRLRDRPEAIHFDDIVETVCEVNFWSETRLEISDIPFMIKEAKYPKFFEDVIEYAELIAKKAESNLTHEKALKEAISGLCLLLMHLIPHNPNSGRSLIKAIYDIPVLKNWQNRWQVLYSLYFQLEAKWGKSPDLKRQFSIVLPIDNHRCIVDMIIFLSAVLKVVNYNPGVITAVFPVILLLLSQASFMVLPVIHVSDVDKDCKAIVDLIHTTGKSKVADVISHTQQKANLTIRKKGIQCGANPISIKLLNESGRFERSSSKNRTWKFVEHILNILPGLVETNIFKKKFNCSGCERIFEGEIFSSALNTIINMSDKTKLAVVDAAKAYDNFLLTDTMNIIEDTWDLKYKPVAIRNYRFI